MKPNPFYALSASAMLLGCWMLGEALHLQAGQARGLLLLMGVLQLYEVLLVGLGTLLVRTGRAPRDGATLLLLETLFLMDAPLLAAECVTADARAGTAAALGVLCLGLAKLAWVRRATPGLLSRRGALVLGVQSAFALALPAAAAHLASTRQLSPPALWLLWWPTLALPLAARRLFAETTARADGRHRSALAAWSRLPGAMILLHLWAVGYIHAIPLRPAYLAPLLLGLAVVGPGRDVARQVGLPALALLVSVAAGDLAFVVPGAGEVSPLRAALLASAVAWAWLAGRDARRGLAVLAAGAGIAGVLGPAGPGLLAAVLAHLRGLSARLARALGDALPRGAFGWGVVALVSAFVLLAAGVRRSLASGSGGGGDAPGGR